MSVRVHYKSSVTVYFLAVDVHWGQLKDFTFFQHFQCCKPALISQMFSLIIFQHITTSSSCGAIKGRRRAVLFLLLWKLFWELSLKDTFVRIWVHWIATYACVQGLRAGEKRTAVSDQNQLLHLVFVDLFILKNCLAQLACRDLCGAVLSVLHSVKLMLQSGDQVRSCGLSSLLIIPLK